MCNTIISKRCSTCKLVKGVGEFFKNRTCKDGYAYSCKACEKQYVIAYRHTPTGKESRHKALKKYNDSDKAKVTREQYRGSQKYADTNRQFRKAYYETYPERDRARKAVKNATRRGDIQVIGTLRCLGGACHSQAHCYHHPSYAEEDILKVVPLCHSCHNHIHQADFTRNNVESGLGAVPV